MTITFTLGNILWTLTASLQLTGSILLLETVMRTNTALLSSSVALTGKINDDGSIVPDNKKSIEIIKKRLQNHYLNWAAFIALVLGYAVSFWSEANTQATWCFALVSMIITMLLYCIIKTTTNKIADKNKHKHTTYKKEDIPTNMVFYIK